ncbi:MAG: DUF2207 domain-containing protein, partial [Woeseiaceae bacterium]
MRRCLLLLLAWLSATAAADERILGFHSDILVFPDGMLEVTETIRVRAEGHQIRRGIYRDFPVEYEDRLGNTYNITLEPLAVLRNDRPEAFHTVRSGRDVRTYFGSSDRFLDHGEHTYVFRYRVNRMLGFFENHDELYWNVTGNNWVFPIDAASATVHLQFAPPRDALMIDAYTGRLGSTAQDYSHFVDADGSVTFEAGNALPASHGLTIVVGWPKGFVTEPSGLTRVGWLLSDNRNLLVALAGLILLFAYYIPVWRKHGKDPEEGVAVTRYEPPAGFSPASLRYIRQMYYDDKVMTAAIVNLAVKGYLEISNDDGTHSLRQLPPMQASGALAPGEKELYEALFAEGSEVTLKNSNHKVLGSARSAHRQSLQQDYRQHYFRTNGLLNIPAALIVVVATVFAVKIGNGPTWPVIATIILSFLPMAFFAVIMRRPTLRGRKVLDEVVGFSDYLEIAEKDEMNLRNPPEKTPRLFESLLPYALALGVEQEWSEKFAKVLAAIRNPDGSGWQPGWYHGSFNTSNLAYSTNSMTSGLSSAVKSSVNPPGSSSGGGGGG